MMGVDHSAAGEFASCYGVNLAGEMGRGENEAGESGGGFDGRDVAQSRICETWAEVEHLAHRTGHRPGGACTIRNSLS